MSVATIMTGIPLNVAGYRAYIKILHGIVSGMTLPYVLDFYLLVMREKLIEIARTATIYINGSIAKEPERVVKVAYNLLKDLGMPLMFFIRHLIP